MVSQASRLQRQLGTECRSVVREAPRLFRTREMPKLLEVPEASKLLEAECSSMRSVACEASSLQRQLGSECRSVTIVVKKAAGEGACEAQKLLKAPKVKPEAPATKPKPELKPEVPVAKEPTISRMQDPTIQKMSYTAPQITDHTVQRITDHTVPQMAAKLEEESRAAGSVAKGAESIASKYRTLIDSKVTIVDKANLSKKMAASFADSQYRTVIVNEDITLYRLFGGRADAGGAFATTTRSFSKIEAKIDMALLPEWGNSRAYEAEILIPKGMKLSIGKVAPQTIESTGTVLTGGADQILLPEDWPLEWIKNIRCISP